MIKRVYSLETEYALAFAGGSPETLTTERAKADLYEQLEAHILSQGTYATCDPTRRAARREDGELVRVGEGYFLGTGARLCYDTGHLEWAAPETSDPYQALLYDRASVLELSAAAVAVETRLVNGRPLIVKNNIDYQSGITYGCHENYSIQCYSRVGRDVRQQIVDQLVPFLVTRQILCGAGRLGADRPPFVPFQLSQRSDFITDVVSQSTRGNRAIINLPDDPLANGRIYTRLRLILGDSNMAEYPILLKLGTTGILLDMIEMDVELPNLAVAQPIDDLHRLSRDLNFSGRLSLKDDGSETAVGIQRAYLNAAWNFVARQGVSDPLAWRILRMWDGLLTAIEHHDSTLEYCLDWAIKRRIIREVLEQAGTTWEELEAWEPVLASTWKLSLPPSEVPVDWSSWLQRCLSRADRSEIEAHCREHRLDLVKYPHFRRIAMQLRALDIYYHDIDCRHSLFHRLSQSVAVAGRQEPEKVRRQAPTDTRAAIRDRAIHMAREKHKEVSLYWDQVHMPNLDCSISLPDPLSNDCSILDRFFAAAAPSGFPHAADARETRILPEGGSMTLSRSRLRTRAEQPFFTDLLEAMDYGLDEGELGELLWRLDVPADRFTGNKRTRIMGLIQHYQRRHSNNLHELLSELVEMAPHVRDAMVDLGYEAWFS